MENRYAILNEVGGWLINLVVWDGNIQTWQPPEGTIARPVSEIDFAELPEKPEELGGVE
jgi:hypothetical protein